MKGGGVVGYLTTAAVTRVPDDALDVNQMNVNSGGKQQCVMGFGMEGHKQ